MKSAGKWLQKSPGWKESLNKSLPLDITLFTLLDDKLFYSIRCISLFLSISLAHQEESKVEKEDCCLLQFQKLTSLYCIKFILATFHSFMFCTLKKKAGKSMYWFLIARF